MARVELNDQNLEGVVGGTFHFKYNSKGQYVCKVDGVGSYYADETAMYKINMHNINAGGGMSDQELVNWAVSQNLFKEP